MTANAGGVVRRSWLVAATALCALTAAPAAAHEAEESPADRGGTFSASTAGTPIGLASGSWQDLDEVDGGRLDVDFVSGPAVVDTRFEATWTTGALPLEPLAEPQVVGSALVSDYLHNTVTDTTVDLVAEYRVRRTGDQWSEWATATESSGSYRRGAPGFRHSSFKVSLVNDCECAYQTQFRVTGIKTGTDASRLSVIAIAGE